MPRWIVYAAYVALYVSLDWISYIHPLLPLAITPWNPPPALSLVLLLRMGSGGWPVLVLAAFLAEWLVRGLPAPLYYTLASSLLLAGGYWGMARLLTGPLRFDHAFVSQRDVLVLLSCVIPGTLLVGAAFVAVYWQAGLVLDHQFASSVLRFWIGDMIGLCVLVPFLLVHWGQTATWSRPGIEQLLQFFSLVLVLWVIFGVEATDEFKFFYLLFLPLIWIAMRQGIRGATLAILLVQLGLIGALQWRGHRATTVLEFQFLMLALAITGLFLGMAVTERWRALVSLQDREAALGKALKSVAVGEMAAVMSHELNQPLMAASNYARACQYQLKAGEAQGLQDTLGKLVGEVGHAGEIVRHLRESYRGEGPRREQIRLDELLAQCMAPLQRQAERLGVRLLLHVNDPTGRVNIDLVQFRMLVHNLVGNAFESLQSRAAVTGTVRVSVGPEVAAGVRVCVEDNGPGVPDVLAARLFHPVVSEKADGMGLGLAICRSLSESHGGRLWHEQLVRGSGARFCFMLAGEEKDATDGIHCR